MVAGGRGLPAPSLLQQLADVCPVEAVCGPARGSPEQETRYPVPTRLCAFSSATQLLAVQRSLVALNESGFYWGAMDGADAQRRLRDEPVGTFLVRDSSDRRHVFSLSLRTACGPTSVRIQLRDSDFQLDSDERQAGAPRFACVLDLLEFYARSGGGARCWIEPGKARASLLLTRPLRHPSVPSLQHLCRKTIHGCLRGHDPDSLKLPSKLQDFLREYPYQL